MNARLLIHRPALWIESVKGTAPGNLWKHRWMKLPSLLAGGLRMAWQTLNTWNNRREERRQLLLLGDHILKDVGITRADVWRETQKKFWQP